MAEQGAVAIRSYSLTSGTRATTISTVPALCGALLDAVPTPFFLTWANPERTALWVSQHGGQARLDRIDLADKSIDPVYEYPSGAPYGMALASNGAVMYVTSENVLQRLDLHTTAASADLTIGYAAAGLPPQEQDGRGTCSVFAITALADYEAAQKAGPGFERLSVEFLVWAANEATGRQGDQAMFYEAVQGLNQYGICKETLMPYAADSDPLRTPSSLAIADANQYKDRWQVHWIRRWSLAGGASADQLLAIKDALAEGHPVACGMRWPIAGLGKDMLIVPSADQVKDGHSIALVGYRDDVTKSGGGVFIFRNSAGASWGDGGYGTMCYAYVAAYANDALWLELGPANSELPVKSFEAESLPIASHVLASAGPQGMETWGTKMWSGGTQLFGGSQDGGIVQLRFMVTVAGTYRVRVLATAAPDFGILDVALDSRLVGAGFDLYSGLVSPAGSLELGTRTLSAGQHTICFKVAGKNAASTAYNFGIDRIDLLTAP